jgi:multiple sugar transport system ATP-binding protein
MDEPLSNLDAKLRVQTRTQIASLQRRLGVTTVYVTHDQVEAMTMGDRVAVLKDGVLQQVDTPIALYERPANVFVAGFIGSPAMNLVQLPIVAGGVQFGNTVLPVGIRPENLKVSSNGIAVEVDVVEELGADGFLYGRTSINGVDQDIVARVEGRSALKTGSKVTLAPEGGITHLFDVETGLRLN